MLALSFLVFLVKNAMAKSTVVNQGPESCFCSSRSNPTCCVATATFDNPCWARCAGFQDSDCEPGHCIDSVRLLAAANGHAEVVLIQLEQDYDTNLLRVDDDSLEQYPKVDRTQFIKDQTAAVTANIENSIRF